MNALTLDTLRHAAPSIFATSPWGAMSHRYKMVPTVEVIDMLGAEGFLPVRAMQSRSRIEGKADFTKHLIRLRRASDLNAEVSQEVPELVLVNSHDGTSGYQLMAGIFRVVCTNGLISKSADYGSISLRHCGGADFRNRVIDATYRVLDDSTQAIASANTWKQIGLSAPQQEAFATAALELRDNAIVRPAQLLRAKRMEDRESADGSRDLWRTFNTVQEHMVRGGDRGIGSTGRRTTTRAINSVDGDLRTNKALWTLASKMAELVS